MGKLFQKLLILIFFTMILNSCSPKDPLPQDEFPDINIPEEEINSRFQISIPKDSGNTYKNGGVLTFLAELTNPDQSIAFDAYTYVKIYAREDNKWIEYTYNEFVNETGDPNVHSWLFTLDANQSVYNNISYQFIVPYIPDLKKPTWFRIFLIGSLYENETITGKTTSAYFDVQLQP